MAALRGLNMGLRRAFQHIGLMPGPVSPARQRCSKVVHKKVKYSQPFIDMKGSLVV